MAEYEQRERAFNQGLAGVFGAFARDIGMADAAIKDAYSDRMARFLDGSKENVEVVTKTSLFGVDQPLTSNLSCPAFMFAATDQGVIDDVELEMDMEVSSHQGSEVSTNTEASASGGAKFSFGPFGGGSVKFSAKTSVGTKQQRSSDYRAKTHAKMRFIQKEAPEGVLMIRDFVLTNQSKALELNGKLIDAQAAKIASELDSSEDTNKFEGDAAKAGDAQNDQPQQ